MSSIPGESTWTDAGLVPPDPDQAWQADPDEVATVPRPDLEGRAAEPDVVEQALDAGEDEDDYPEG
ncbi:MAG TPA: hypothetical protein PKB06_03440 [Actinotalea sp.]|nr:hypothetical protein [Actinotalea sp.]